MHIDHRLRIDWGDANLLPMPSRVLVAGSPHVLDAVRVALPDMEVALARAPIDEAILCEFDCVVVGTDNGVIAETWQPLAANLPLVWLVPSESDTSTPAKGDDHPFAHAENPRELRLAIRTAILEHRARTLLAELAGAWSHDARGALGVVRLALELIKASSPPASPTQKMENGLLRLGFLLERLPSQLALALDMPLAERNATSLFSTLEAYVKHLRLVHSHRQVELSGGAWPASEASRVLVPFAAGFAELALSLSAAKTTLRFSADPTRGLELECECPGRAAPWNAGVSLGARELTHRPDGLVPYRLVEAARLALRYSMPLTVEVSERGLLARVRPSEDEAVR